MLLEQWAVQLERGGENGVEQHGSAATQASRPGISLPPMQATAPPQQQQQQPPFSASYNDDDGMDLDAAEEQPAYHPTQSSASHAHNHAQHPGSQKTRPREESLDALSIGSTTAATAEVNWNPELAKKRPHSGTNWSWPGERNSDDRSQGYRNRGGRTLRALPSSGRGGSGRLSTASSAWAAPSSRS